MTIQTVSNLSAVEHHPVVIIGSGPGGLTAAIYTARANLSPLLVRGAESGGQLMNAAIVENYPGFTEGVLGPDLIQAMENQAERVGAELRSGFITAVDFSTHPFMLVVDNRHLLSADAVIIATGASAKFLGLENERRFLGRGVSACATCDGAFFKNEAVAVIGGGDTALEEALFLARSAAQIYVIHRRNRLRATNILQDRAVAHERIDFIWNTTVEDILGTENVEGLLLRNTLTGEQSLLTVQGLFLAIGHRPNTALFQNWLELNEQGYIQTLPGTTQTTIPGVFACGDVQDRIYRQVVTAAGSGCMAAIESIRWLTEREPLTVIAGKHKNATGSLALMA